MPSKDAVTAELLMIFALRILPGGRGDPCGSVQAIQRIGRVIHKHDAQPGSRRQTEERS